LVVQKTPSAECGTRLWRISVTVPATADAGFFFASFFFASFFVDDFGAGIKSIWIREKGAGVAMSNTRHETASG
jgi:hypothetical protein